MLNLHKMLCFIDKQLCGTVSILNPVVRALTVSPVPVVVFSAEVVLFVDARGCEDRRSETPPSLS